MSLPSKEELLKRVATARLKWSPRPSDITLEPLGPGEESVWDYPRPPIIETVAKPVNVMFAGQSIAASTNTLRILETAGAPVYYFPPEDVRFECLNARDGYSVCEWKGAAIHYDVIWDKRRAEQAAFSYPDPLNDLTEGYTSIAGWIGFYPGRVDACSIGNEQVTPQPGGVYAGWVTKAIKGPIKGDPGTEHW